MSTAKQRRVHYKTSEAHREWRRAYNRKWRAEHLEQALAIERASRERNRERLREYHRVKAKEWREKNPERHKANTRAQYYRTRERHLGRSRRHRWRLRAMMIQRYGGRCVCCGETNYHFLSLDHINGLPEGMKRKDQVGGAAFYAKLARAGWPDGYQVLCYNCNCAKGHYGMCPHESARQLADNNVIEEKSGA